MKIISTGIVLLLFFVPVINAQDYIEIDSQGTVVMCSDSITDSDSIGTYGTNESYQITICPDETFGSKVQLVFKAGIDIDPSDTLYVYDGTSTSAPLLMKINNNVNNPGVDMPIEATFSNNSGCITLSFVSDGANNGTGWVAGVNCFRPCQTIIPEIVTTSPVSLPNNDGGYIDICFGDMVTFNAQGGYPQSDIGSPWYHQEDATSQFIWIFGDGDTLSGIGLTSVNHTYDFFIKGFKVELLITDDFGCNSATKAERKVRTSTQPQFKSLNILDDIICYGQSVKVKGGVIGTESNFITGSTHNELLQIPDNDATSYESVVNITGFGAGQKITSLADFELICMDIEHSNINDLSIKIVCPEGNSATLLQASNGATDVYLGEPVDFESNSTEINTVGETYHYCFSIFPEYGKFSAEAGNYKYSYTDVLGNLQENKDYLPAGIYTPFQTYSSLVGCSLNGEWSLSITDNQSSNNGFVENWGILFAPSLISTTEYYTPTYNVADFVWSGNDIVSTNMDTALIQPSSGNFNNTFNFSVTDNHGCGYDTTFYIYTPSIAPEIIGDANVCNGTNAKLKVDSKQNNSCNYTLKLYDSGNNDWDGASVDVYINSVFLANYTGTGNVSSYNLSIANTNNIQIIFNGGNTNEECSYQLFDSEGIEVFYQGQGPLDGQMWSGLATCIPENLTYLWNNAPNIVNKTLQEIVIVTPVDGIYSVTVTDAAYGCTDYASITLTSVPNFNYTVTPQEKSICYTEDVTFTTSVEPGNYTYEWLPTSLFANNTNPNATAYSPIAGIYEVVVAIESDQGCINRDTIPFNVSSNSAPIVNVNTYPSLLCALDNDSALLTTELIDTTNRTCNYTLMMYDKFGDDWNGAFISVTTDGIDAGNYTIPSPGVGANVAFDQQIPVNNGVILELTYNPGGWEQEVYYDLLDASGNVIFSDGPNPSTGLIYSNYTSCPSSSLQTSYLFTWDSDLTLNDVGEGNAYVKPTTNSTYSLTVTDSIGKCQVVKDVVVSVTNQKYEINIIADDYYCNVESIDTLITANLLGKWSGTGIIEDSLGIFDPSIASQGLNTIYYEIPGACGSIDSAIIHVISPDSVIASSIGDYCVMSDNDTLSFYPVGGVWNGTGIINDSLGVFEPSIEGQYELYYTYDKCLVIDTVYVVVQPNYDVTFTLPAEICDGGQQDTITFNGVDAGGEWSGSGIVDQLLGYFDPSKAQLGYNVITYEFVDGCMDKYIDSLYIGNPKTATITPVSNICTNVNPFQLEITTNSSGIWSGGAVNTDGVFDPTLGNVGANSVIFQTTGGCDVSDTLIVTIVSLPEADYVVLNESCQNAKDGSIETTPFGGLEPYILLWSTNDTVNSLTMLSPGDYVVSITDGNGCIVTDSLYIELSEELCETPALFVANIFSPNGDGSNEVFMPKGYKVSSFNMQIFDRYGKKVFEGDNEGWDGNIKLKPAAVGVYVYDIKYVMHSGQEDELKGTITLVR